MLKLYIYILYQGRTERNARKKIDQGFVDQDVFKDVIPETYHGIDVNPNDNVTEIGSANEITKNKIGS